MAGVLVAVPPAGAFPAAVPPAESLGITASSCLWPTPVTRVGQRKVTRLTQLLRSSSARQVVEPTVVDVHVHVVVDAAVGFAHGGVVDVGAAVVVVRVGRGSGRGGVAGVPGVAGVRDVVRVVRVAGVGGGGALVAVADGVGGTGTVAVQRGVAAVVHGVVRGVTGGGAAVGGHLRVAADVAEDVAVALDGVGAVGDLVAVADRAAGAVGHRVAVAGRAAVTEGVAAAGHVVLARSRAGAHRVAGAGGHGAAGDVAPRRHRGGAVGGGVLLVERVADVRPAEVVVRRELEAVRHVSLSFGCGEIPGRLGLGPSRSRKGAVNRPVVPAGGHLAMPGTRRPRPAGAPRPRDQRRCSSRPASCL